jgi:TRAP-type C4-dicarboxylate transport system substrate-binding protein
MSAAIRPVLTKIFAEQGIIHLGVMYTYAGGTFASVGRHYRTPNDLKGQKIRMPGIWNTKYAGLWGATPTNILPPEIYPSLQKGVIDGMDTVLDLVWFMKYYEVAPYITERTGTESALVIWGMNMKKFNSLDKKYQEIILGASREAELYSFDYGRKSEEKMRKEIATKAKYIMLTPAEVRPFLDAIAPVRKEMRGYCGPLGNELMDVLEKIKK